uniref:BTB domain-containing protein n=1 Tax=Rhabditophanes sp. KR3021 TaxID=114890 RepID=A0AC35TK25_9BILA
MATRLITPNFNYFVDNDVFTDAQLCFTDGSKIKVSRIILCGYSDYFMELFLQNIEETIFPISNMTLTDFKVFYDYILLGDKFVINANNFLSILNVQKVFNISGIENLISNWITKDENYLYQGIVFESTSDTKLEFCRKMSRILIDKEFMKLCKINAFDSFDISSFMELFDQKFIQSKDQDDVLEVITRWIEYDFKNRSCYWIELIQKLNYEKVSKSFLTDYMEKNPKVYESPQLTKFLVSKLSEKIKNETVSSAIIKENIVVIDKKSDAMDNFTEELIKKIRTLLNDKFSLEQIKKEYFNCDENIGRTYQTLKHKK